MQVQSCAGNAQRERGQAGIIEALSFLMGKHDLEHRRPARVEISLEPIDEKAEGKILVLEAQGDGSAHLVEVLLKRRVSGKVAPHRHHVDEVADQPLETRPGPPHDRRANEDVVLSC